MKYVDLIDFDFFDNNNFGECFVVAVVVVVVFYVLEKKAALAVGTVLAI